MGVDKKPPLIIVTGPTASGKSSVGIELATRLGGEVVSADSVQIYKGMDIGSAKLERQEMRGVEHFLIDKLNPDEPFNVSEFVNMANEAISDIYGRGKLPIVVGGTAFYIQALLKGVEFGADTGADESFRRDAEDFLHLPDEAAWEIFFQKYFKSFCEGDDGRSYYKGASSLYEFLKHADPSYAETIHENNIKRLIRALEYFKSSGEKFSDYNKREGERGAAFDFIYFVLEDERGALYERINGRVDEMIRQGLEAEVRALLDKGYDRGLKSMQSIGYKEMCAYIFGECGFDAAVEAIKQNTRHFAKRQITWFRRERDVIPVNVKDFGYDAVRVAESICERVLNLGLLLE